MLGKGVAGDVRFLKQGESGNASAGELMPLRFGHRMQIHLRDEIVEEVAQSLWVGESRRITMVRFDDPFTP
jgi:hypothetical protein